MQTINKVSIQDLQHRGLPISRGSKYVPQDWVVKKVPTLHEIHKRLSKIKGSLAAEIAKMREQES